MPTVPETGRFEYPEDNWAVGRMRRSGEEPQMAGLLDTIKGIFGGSRESEAKGDATVKTEYSKAKPMGEYPSDADAEFAKNHGFGYGTIHEPYINNQTAKVFGEVRTQTTPGGKGKPDKTESRFVSFTPEGQTISGLMNYLNDKTKAANIDLTKPEFKDVKDRIGHTYTKAALAVEGNSIAKLGYDPSIIMADVSGAKTNLSGAYNYPENPGGEGIYASLTDPSVLVHESMHRGIKKLTQIPEAKKLLDQLPSSQGGHEMLVRYMMAKFAGDPERIAPSGREDPQRNKALELYADKTFGKQWTATVDKLLDVAAQEVAKKRPGGPR